MLANEFRLLIAGSRTFKDYDFLCRTADGFIKLNNTSDMPVVIVSGNARGADLLGEEYALSRGYRVARFPADWHNQGKKAGYLRNCKMADYLKESENGQCIVFWDGISKGSKHMIDICRNKSIPCLIKLFR